MQSLSDQEIISLIEQYMHGSNHPDQVGYRKQTYERDFADKRRFLWFVRKHMVELGGYHGKKILKILDVGCGLGWHAFTISILAPRNRVIGLDILPSMHAAMSESIETMRKAGVKFDLTPVLGDICDIDLPAASLDSIYSMESIEHVHDVRRMFKHCFDLLKPGGNMLIINDSNSLHTHTRRETMAMWQEREHSWEWVAKLKNWRPIEHGNAKPFAVMREEIAREANPLLTKQQFAHIVEETAGLIKPEIEQIARNYSDRMAMPAIGKYDRCRNPETGEYAERLLNPFELADILTEVGFKPKVRHGFRRFPLNWMNAIELRVLNNLLFNFRGLFVIFAEKPGSSAA
jgi:SAM-dependent methyltransferase